MPKHMKTVLCIDCPVAVEDESMLGMETIVMEPRYCFLLDNWVKNKCRFLEGGRLVRRAGGSSAQFIFKGQKCFEGQSKHVLARAQEESEAASAFGEETPNLRSFPDFSDRHADDSLGFESVLRGDWAT